MPLHHSFLDTSVLVFTLPPVDWLRWYPGATPGCGDDAARHSVRESELPAEMARLERAQDSSGRFGQAALVA